MRACLSTSVALSVLAFVAAHAQVFRAGVDLVHFAVVVTDKQGQPVSGLTADDFQVLERGKPQRITYFSTAEGTALAPPLHLGLLLDASGSMDADIKDVRTAVIKFLNQNAHAVDITIVDFDTEVRVARYGPDDYPRMIERIRRRKADGWTAWYDALGVYLDGASRQDGQKILLAYTDGGDTRSSMNAVELADLLKASDVTLYAIGYLEHQTSSSRNATRMELMRFAALTGGQAFFPASIKELDEIYRNIQREISARYTLGYSSSDDRADGAWRQVEVKLTRGDLKSAKLRTRPGYFAPYRESSAKR
jgi:Ca-activated chloride channel family protein